MLGFRLQFFSRLHCCGEGRRGSRYAERGLAATCRIVCFAATDAHPGGKKTKAAGKGEKKKKRGKGGKKSEISLPAAIFGGWEGKRGNDDLETRGRGRRMLLLGRRS